MQFKTDLVVVAKEPFPIGMAATNRMLSYIKEIAKHKKVTVLLAQPTEFGDQINNKDVQGTVHSINYKYIHNTTIWPIHASKFKKGLILLKAYFILIKELFQLKPKSVLVVTRDIMLIYELFFLSKILSFNYFHEISEKPLVLQNKSNPLYKKFYLFSFRLYTGMVVMTYELIDLFKSLKQTQLFHLPMTVDFDRFQNPTTKSLEARKNYIFKYCGGGTVVRDGLNNMVKAFIDLRKSYQNFEFHIIGPYDEEPDFIQNIMDMIAANDANKYIQFMGPKPSHEIPSILFDADFLILTPPKDYITGGFPTKLGEYLATGKPVICTTVSEIPSYLNEHNAILVEPNNHNMLVDSLKKVLNNPDAYITIGENGKTVAEKNFTMKNHTENLIDFLKI